MSQAAAPPPDQALPSVDPLRERFAAGDERALKECRDRVGALLLANARRIVGPNDAEDVVQTVMIEAWGKRHMYDASHPLEAWLLTILRRRAIDLLRRRKAPAATLDAIQQWSSEDGRETAERVAGAVDVRRALDALPDHQREPLVLSYFAGMSQAEVAIRIGVPLGTVKTRTRSGLARLADRLSSEWVMG